VKKGRRVLLLVVGVLLLVVLIAAVVLDVKYGLIRSSPRVSHESLSGPRTSFRARLEPALAEEFIVARYGARMPVPEWALPMVLPYEVAVLCDPDLTQNRMAVEVFVNDRRLGPVIARGANESGMLSRIRGVQWEPPGFVRRERGVLLLEGEGALDGAVVSLVRERWGVVAPLSPLELGDEEHLFEAVLDFRDGRGFAVLAQAVGRGVPPSSPAHPSQLIILTEDIAHIRLYGDLVSVDTLHLQFRIECRPEVPDEDVSSLNFLIGAAYGQLQPSLKQVHGVDLEGGTEVDGSTIVGEYDLTHFERVLTLMGLRM